MFNRILKAAGLVSFLTLVSRITGFLREILAASLFGLSPPWDAFALAFQIQNLVRQWLGEGSLSHFLIPIFSGYLAEKKHQKLIQFVRVAFTMVTSASLTLMVIAWGSSWALSAYSPTPWNLLFWKLFRCLLPYMPIICLTVFFSAILQSYKRFVLPAIAPVVLNLVWIGALFYAKHAVSTPQKQILIIAYAVVAGSVLGLLLQVWGVLRHRLSFRPSWPQPGTLLSSRYSKDILLFSGIALFAQLNSLMDSLMAKWLVPEVGAISALYFANRLLLFPVGLFGTSFATTFFPYISETVHNRLEFLARFRRAFTLSFLGFTYLGLFTYFLSVPLVIVIYRRGAFSAEEVVRTSLVLKALGIGLCTVGGSMILLKTIYALRKLKLALLYSALSLLLNVILNAVLAPFLYEAGIALSTSLAQLLALGFFFILVRDMLSTSSRDMVDASLLSSGKWLIALTLAALIGIPWMAPHFLPFSPISSLYQWVLIGSCFIATLPGLWPLLKKVRE